MAREPKARETFSRYDTADYLKSEDAVLAYLEAAMDEAGDDTALIAVALGNVARARGMMQLARETGLTREGLYKALSADGNPSLGTVLKVMGALGIRLTPQRVGAPARRNKRRVA
jgi:probable addiction module antidote protein